MSVFLICPCPHHLISHRTVASNTATARSAVVNGRSRSSFRVRWRSMKSGFILGLRLRQRSWSRAGVTLKWPLVSTLWPVVMPPWAD